MIEHLADVYPEYAVGYSDHVPPDDGMVTLLNSVVRGADVIEKHFTLDKSLDGNDHYHAMNPGDIHRFRDHTDLLAKTTGQRKKEPISAEADSRSHARRSVVAATDIPAGERIERQQLAIKRPGTGISPRQLDDVIGQTASVDIAADDILDWNMI
jgi:N-acetylneuraminate synthase